MWRFFKLQDQNIASSFLRPTPPFTHPPRGPHFSRNHDCHGALFSPPCFCTISPWTHLSPDRSSRFSIMGSKVGPNIRGGGGLPRTSAHLCGSLGCTSEARQVPTRLDLKPPNYKQPMHKQTPPQSNLWRISDPTSTHRNNPLSLQTERKK